MDENKKNIYQFEGLDSIITNISDCQLLCRLLFQGSYDLMMFASTIGKLILINDAGFKFSGFTREEIIGKHILKIPGVFNKKEFGRTLKIFTKAIRGIPSFDFETYPVDKYGKKHTMIFNVLPIKHNNKVKYILILAKDITEQRQNEQLFKEANQSRAHLKNVIDSANEIIFGLDEKNRITTWNNAMSSLTGITQSSVIGNKINRLDIFPELTDFLNYTINVKKGNKDTFDELSVTTKIGFKRLLSVSGSIIRNNEGEITGTIFVGRDITEEKNLHGRLIPGRCYVKTGKDDKTLFHCLNDLIKEGYHGLILTRDFNEQIQAVNQNKQSDIFYLGEDTYKNEESIKNSDQLVNLINEKLSHYKRLVILLTRLDYLLINESFNSVIRNLYRVSSQVKRTNSIFLMHMNTKLLSEQEHEFIMQEFKNIPQIGLPNITLKDSMIEIIEYVNRQKNMNLMVTFKKLGRDLAISKSTVAKRIRFLENQKLIITIKSGRSKSISLTDKGEALIKKIRKTKSSE